MSSKSIEEYKREVVQTAYLRPDDPANVARMLPLVEPFGLRLVDDDPNRLRLEGEGVDFTEEFKTFDKLVELIANSIHLSDVEFVRDIIPQLVEIARLNSHLFGMLDSNPAGLNNPPFEHTFEALASLDTRQLDGQLERGLLRMEVLFHDIGKIFLAAGQNDFMQDHARLSAMIIDQYLQSRDVDSELSQNITKQIRLHHLLEQLDFGRLTIEEARQLLELEKMPEFARLSYLLFVIADVSSVDGYEKFIRYNLAMFFRLVGYEVGQIEDVDTGENIGTQLEQAYSFGLLPIHEIQNFAASVIALIDRLLEKGESLVNTCEELLRLLATLGARYFDEHGQPNNRPSLQS
jgi:hypothetical protein